MKKLKQIFVIGVLCWVAFACNKETDAKPNKPAVYVHENNGGFELMRNGKPFFIKGGAAHPDYLVELKEAGANTARIYDTINLHQTLDLAQELGLAVVVDIPMPKFHTDGNFYEDEELFTKLRARVKRVIKAHKDHPALLYWNLGNELYYPYFYKSTKFFSNFNILIDLIHEIDPNHPVSTVTIGANKLRVLSIHRKSPQLDFISFNSFGVLSQFKSKLKPISPIWDGTHVITEWGVNGPWEAQLTTWKAPIEETSTKKAEQIRQRYFDYMEPLKEINNFGSFIFYWGQKNEVTPTWYSLFRQDKMKTQGVYELSKIWNENDTSAYQGPSLDYIYLNKKGALDNIILLPGDIAEVEVFSPAPDNGNLEYSWEIRHESWNEFEISEKVNVEEFNIEGNKATFITPQEDGPYRIFLYLTNGTEYMATANIPFYILTPANGE